jgi:DNA-binding XRE family transcriptional regulator
MILFNFIFMSNIFVYVVYKTLLQKTCNICKNNIILIIIIFFNNLAMIKENIWSIIKNLREKFKVSQDDLSRYIWISRVSLANLEIWKKQARENEIEKIAEFFEEPLCNFYEKENKKDEKRNLKNLIIYISEQYKDKKNFWITMLNKLLYFSDFNYYEWTWTLISWSRYKKLPYWPVPEDIIEVLKQMQKDWEIVLQEEKIHNYSIQKIRVLRKTENKFFEKIDKQNRKKRKNYTLYEDLPTPQEIVDDVLDKYKKWKTTDLSDLSHEDTPYKASKNFWDIIKPIHVFYRSKSFVVNHHNL